MWFKTKLSNKVDVVKGNTIINSGNDNKINEIYLMVGEIKGALNSINHELKYIHRKLDHLEEDNATVKNRLSNLENNYYRNGRRY